MCGLSDLVKVMENNMECGVLKVKDDMQLSLIFLGCFDGNETMFRLTKGDNHTCTVFLADGRTYSWYWGKSGSTLVSDSTQKKGDMIQTCIADDFNIYIGENILKRKETLYIKTLQDAKGKPECYRLMWWENMEDICIHKNGEYHKYIVGLENAKSYVKDKIVVSNISEIRRSDQTGCYMLDISGNRK